MAPQSVADRVAKGAALLDRELPDWAREIDLERLDITQVDDCILGQLYTSWADGMISLFGSGCVGTPVGSDHGFNLTPFEWDEYNDGYGVEIDLFNAWSVEVHKRVF